MYDSLEYIVDLKKKGQYPKIHDDIFSLHKYIKATNVLDVGCCHGLLSHRLGTVYNSVVGIEPSKKYCKNLVPKENVTYYNFKVTNDSIFKLYSLLKKHNIDGVFCRRVVSEIYSTGGSKLVKSFVGCLVDADVKYVALEGRIKFKNSTHPLSDYKKEMAFFLNDYELIGQKNNAVALRLKS